MSVESPSATRASVFPDVDPFRVEVFLDFYAADPAPRPGESKRPEPSRCLSVVFVALVGKRACDNGAPCHAGSPGNLSEREVSALMCHPLLNVSGRQYPIVCSCIDDQPHARHHFGLFVRNDLRHHRYYSNWGSLCCLPLPSLHPSPDCHKHNWTRAPIGDASTQSAVSAAADANS